MPTQHQPLATVNRTRADDAYQILRALLDRPDSDVGDRLPPVRKLAVQCRTSVPTIQTAMARLEEEGLIVRRQGAGSFVAAQHRPVRMSESVAICLETTQDVFGELTSHLLRTIQLRGQFGTVIDIGAPDAGTLIQGMSHSDVRCFLMHGHLHFPFKRLLEPAFRRKPVIGLVDWETNADIPLCTHVTTDYDAGARQVSTHLAELGHRHILFVGTGTQIWHLEHFGAAPSLPNSMARAWEATGGTWSAQAVEIGEQPHMVTLPRQQALAIFQSDTAPTAIIALRDVDAAAAQRLLRDALPERWRDVAIVGYFDTPHSAAGDPPITTVNLDIPRIAAEAADIVQAVLANPVAPLPAPCRVPPRLIVRDTSYLAPRT